MAARFTVCDVRNDRIIAENVEIRRTGNLYYWGCTYEGDLIGLNIYDAMLINEQSIVVFAEDGLFQIVLTNGEWASIENLYKSCRKPE